MRKFFHFILSCIFVIIFSFNTAICFSEPCMIPPGYQVPKELNMVFGVAKTTPFYKFYNEVYTHVFRETGKALGGGEIKLKLESYPALRAIYYLRNGEVDGDVWRVSEYADAFNLNEKIKCLSEPTAVGSFVAFTMKKEIADAIDGWQSFKNKNWSVNYRRGTIGPMVNLPKYLPKNQIKAVSNHLSGLLKLSYGRIDVFIAAPNILNELSHPQLKDIRFIIIKKKLPVAVNCWLINKHAPLIPFAEEALRIFKKNGGIRKLEIKYNILNQDSETIMTQFNRCLE